ncbi:MAG: pyridoxal 5'-phosphate synthase glutaminase subunit PdxT [Alphaproteobacteria bacterium]|nr:pyridoxal 5'-phosphate synthase glutaminase subunit PdxT [Alphaproteobacteria bacterium]
MSKKDATIGVLALQGAVELHRPHIEACGADFKAVKTQKQFEDIDAFILPGGESTTMLRLIRNFGLWDALAENFKTKPVWGICAGSILMAEKVTNPAQDSFGILPFTVERNGYGRQLESHHSDINGYKVSFIRAPIITDIGKDVEILAEHEGSPVWVQKGNKIASTFHPELTEDYPSPMHRHFIDLVRSGLSCRFPSLIYT